MATIPKMRNHVSCNFMLARKLCSLMLNNMRWMCANLHDATLPIQLQSGCGSCAAQLDTHGQPSTMCLSSHSKCTCAEINSLASS